jgi:hypothetical protein
VKATTEGVVVDPTEFAMAFGTPFSTTATHELVVPRSIPMIGVDWEAKERRKEENAWSICGRWFIEYFNLALNSVSGNIVVISVAIMNISRGSIEDE